MKTVIYEGPSIDDVKSALLEDLKTYRVHLRLRGVRVNYLPKVILAKRPANEIIWEVNSWRTTFGIRPSWQYGLSLLDGHHYTLIREMEVTK